MMCCGPRIPQLLYPASKDSPFDVQLLEGFAKIQKKGNILRNNPAVARRRRLEGTLGLIVQAAEEIFTKARELPPAGTEVTAMPDPEAFNFTKVDEAERIVTLDLSQDGKVPVTVLASASPIAKGHIVVVPRCAELLPHHLTEETLRYGLQFLARSGRRDFKLFFDSLGAGERVNHFHYDGLYVSNMGCLESRLPIEFMERGVVTGDVTGGRACIEILNETAWYLRGFVVSAGPSENNEEQFPQGDLEVLAFVTSRLVSELQQRNLPHTVIISPPHVARFPNALSVERRLAGALEDGMQCTLSPEIFVLPRRPQETGNQRLGCELAGLIMARTDETYCSITEGYLKEMFSNDVSCKAPLFDELLCKAAWLSN